MDDLVMLTAAPHWTMPRDMAAFSSLEAALLASIHAAGLPQPVGEHHFDWCCEHVKRAHHAPPKVATTFCSLCEVLNAEPLPGDPIAPTFHGYRHGRGWRFDFAYPDRKLAIECEGGTHSGGRHTRGAGYGADLEKYNAAVLRGWTLLRFDGAQIASGEALELVERALRAS